MKLLLAPIMIGATAIGYGLTYGTGRLLRFIDGTGHPTRSPPARARRAALIVGALALTAFVLIVAGLFAFLGS